MNDYQAQCKALSEFYAKVAETGNSLEIFVDDEWIAHLYGPNLGSNLKIWRIKPSPRKAYVVWIPCDWNDSFNTIAPTFKSFEKAEKWNNRNAGGKGKIQEIVCPE